MISALLAWVVAIQAWGTTFYERPFPSSVRDAPGIVRGKVGMSYSDWSVGSDGAKRIYTFTELAPTEVFKGDVKGTSIILRELGGEKDGVAMEVSGVARFERGEDVVVMIGPVNKDSSYDVRGMMMAKFEIELGTDGREYLNGPGLGGSREHVHADTQPQEGAAPRRRWSVEDLRELVKSQGSLSEGASRSQAQPQSSGAAPAQSGGGTSDAATRSAAVPAPREETRAAPVEGVTDTPPGSKAVLLLGMGLIIGAVVYLLTRGARKK